MQPFKVLPYESESFKKQQALVLKLEKLFEKYQKELIKLGISTNFKQAKKSFSFDKYPNINKIVDELIKAMRNNVSDLILNAEVEQFDLANSKNDAFLKHVFGNRLKEVPSNYFERNKEGLQAFQQRKITGLNLSDRVWNYTKQFKNEMELALDVSLDGRPASQIAKEIKPLLKEPDKLFRRIRDKKGNLKLSKAAKAYHPGQGVYRSSYKNAERLARTEINMAYRLADHLRFNKMDFVVGFEVRLSNRGDSCPTCVALAGKYPKTFKFRSWHSNCRCFVVAILSTEDEFFESLDDNYKPKKSENEINKPHDNFYKWLDENKERIKSAKSTPYFVGDNPKYFKGIRDNTT
jgi:hypothetical protein